MKLSISNIAWDKEEDSDMYKYLQQQKISGIEIAPTRIFESNPYDHLEEAEKYRLFLYKMGIEVSSLQSIWYGRQENIFSSEKDMKALEEYTHRAILFAERLNCKNLVFGCPRNRNVNGEMTISKLNNAVEFFRRIGDFAYTHNTCFSLEPNPKMYNTNFVNTTNEAIEMVKKVGSPGFKVNLDFGTIIANSENVNMIDVTYVNHVHIIEPGLSNIKNRQAHKELISKLKKSNYNGYISIEMGKSNVENAKNAITYLKSLEG